jgi:hypothetical protein
MAANATGHRQTDHLKIMALVEVAANSPPRCSSPAAPFVAKVLQGGTEASLLASLKRDFASVKHIKPAASRADSAELYLVATGFRAGKREQHGLEARHRKQELFVLVDASVDGDEDSRHRFRGPGDLARRSGCSKRTCRGSRPPARCRC